MIPKSVFTICSDDCWISLCFILKIVRVLFSLLFSLVVREEDGEEDSEETLESEEAGDGDVEELGEGDGEESSDTLAEVVGLLGTEADKSSRLLMYFPPVLIFLYCWAITRLQALAFWNAIFLACAK